MKVDAFVRSDKDLNVNVIERIFKNKIVEYASSNNVDYGNLPVGLVECCIDEELLQGSDARLRLIICSKDEDGKLEKIEVPVIRCWKINEINEDRYNKDIERLKILRDNIDINKRDKNG